MRLSKVQFKVQVHSPSDVSVLLEYADFQASVGAVAVGILTVKEMNLLPGDNSFDAILTASMGVDLSKYLSRLRL